MLIVFPLAFVASPLDIGVDAVTVGFVVEPVTIVDVAIGVEEFTSSASLVILPHAFVARLVWPHHGALAMPQAPLPLALVDSPCLVVVGANFNGDIFLVNSTQRLLRFFVLEILAVHLGSHLQDLVLPSLQEAPHQSLDPDQHSVVIV